MDDLQVKELYIYPIKSLKGIQVQNSWVEERGLKFDRRWMLVDSQYNFITQRKHHSLSQVEVSLIDDGFEIKTPNKQVINVGFDNRTGKKFRVSVWDSICTAEEMSIEANHFFSEFLKMEVHLVYMPESSDRRVDIGYAINNERVSFADAYPILLIGQGSLDDLNQRLEKPMAMNRFRPNIIVSTSVPFIEDTWRNFSIGEANFTAVKPCSRCVVTTINQETGIVGAEPLKTLATYRNFNNKIMFGQNVLFHKHSAKIAVGDSIFVRSKKELI